MLISKFGADSDARTLNNITPLHAAAARVKKLC